ncbi:hypothetical protein [Pedobacter nutrimenti]|uniref:hypothetical protein n=1 Tax=Pedobacter nutrimenti TaxID=1241337 RepID=UPI00293194D2|nr:hypothetical protein [Pedobacter nutrimenti]
MRDSITFFYPSKAVGGAQYLIVRLAIEIASKIRKKIYIIDFNDGFIWNKVRNYDNIALISYKEEEIVELPTHTTLLIFPGHFSKIGREISNQNDANIIVWFIQPYLLINLPKFKNLVRFFMRNRIKKIGKLLNGLSANSSLLFMDEENFTVNKEYFNLGIYPEYLPIPTDKKTVTYNKSKKRGFNIAWLGRVTSEKIESIKYVLNDIIRFNERNESSKIRFHIIGDGDLIDILSEISMKNPNTEVLFKGILIGEKLIDYMFREIDCMFAMGTSALDAASYKIPTILLDYTSKKNILMNNNYRYKWIFDTKGFMLGIDLAFNTSTNELNLMDIVTHVSRDSINQIGEKCFLYVDEYHSVENIGIKLNEYADKSTFLVRNATKFNIRHTFLIDSVLRLKKVFSRW